MSEEKRESIGKVFHKLTAIIYGGKIIKNGGNDPVLGNPDIIYWDKNQVY